MRLIDAEVLQAKFEGLREKDAHATGTNAYDLCAMLTEDAPTINAVELPCNVGDIVYMLNINKGKGMIDTKEVSNIDVEIFSSGNVTIQIWFKTAGFCFGNQFGKVAFLDKREAGKELIRRTTPHKEQEKA